MERPAPSAPGLAAVLAVAMGVGPLLLYAVSTLSPVLVPELGLSRTQYGTLATAMFAAGALASLVAGRIVDATAARTVLWWLIGGAIGAVFLGALAPGYWLLLAAVVASGALQALSNPVTNRAAMQWVGPGRRGLVMGVKQSGVQMTQAVTGFVLPAMALWLGWRGSMALAGALWLLVGVLLTARHVPRETVRVGTTRAADRAKVPAPVWWLTGYAFLTAASLQGINFHLPLYGYESLGMPLATAGLLSAVVGTVGIAGRIVWGQVAQRRSAGVPLVLVAAGGALAMLLILAAPIVHSGLIWLGAALHGASAVAANAVVMVTLVRTVPGEVIGRASGLVAVGMYVGFAGGPLMVGALVDATGTYTAAWLTLVAGFGLAVAFGVVLARQR